MVSPGVTGARGADTGEISDGTSSHRDGGKAYRAWESGAADPKDAIQAILKAYELGFTTHQQST